jgi:hypothetical protein
MAAEGGTKACEGIAAEEAVVSGADEGVVSGEDGVCPGDGVACAVELIGADVMFWLTWATAAENCWTA